MKLKVKILALVLAALAAFGAVGCSDFSQTFDQLKCSHNYSKVTVVEEATCQQEGLEIRTCSNCGNQKEFPVTKLNHKEVVEAAVSATSISPGSTEGRYCSVCNEVIKEKVDIARRSFYVSKPTYLFREDAEGNLIEFGLSWRITLPDFSTVKSQGGIVRSSVCYYYPTIAPMSKESLFGENPSYFEYDFSTGVETKGDKVFCLTISYDKYDDSKEEFKHNWGVPLTGSKKPAEKLRALRACCFYIQVGEEYYFAEYDGAYEEYTTSFYAMAKEAVAGGELTQQQRSLLYEYVINVVESA